MPASQSEVLRGLWALYQATNGSEWTNATGWSNDMAPCSSTSSAPFGVSCRGDRVSSVYMRGNGLAGNLPTQVRDEGTMHLETRDPLLTLPFRRHGRWGS